MQATAPQLSGHERTRALIEQIAGGAMGGRLRSEVARWQPAATRDQIEEAFQEACLLASRACRGQSEGEVFVWLRTTTHREVGHMLRRARREVLVDSALLPEGLVATPQPSAEEEVIDQEDREEVLRLTRCVLDRLTDTQRNVAALHGHGRRRKEIAEHLGLSPRTVKRALERILATARTELVHLAGHGCDTGEELVARFAQHESRERPRAHSALSNVAFGSSVQGLDPFESEPFRAGTSPTYARARPTYERAAPAESQVPGRGKSLGLTAGPRGCLIRRRSDHLTG